MTARKIRMTAVGLIAMPADRDEALVSADDIPSDPALCTAWAELQDSAGRMSADRHDAFTGGRLDACEAAWNAVLSAALDNDLAWLRAALAHARIAALATSLPSDHEDAALAMLPEDAS